ncbi:MAG: metallophosphoesterase [Planctomycetes bacterium]|nr:metallophosphoesterase [Planctomycetota bacterium]
MPGWRRDNSPVIIMNEIIFNETRRLLSGHSLRKLFWDAAKYCALGGLYIWNMGEHWIRVERRDMLLPNLGPEFDGATIVQISDLHCSPIVLERYLRQCVEVVNALDADFVAITGDMITGPKHYARRIAGVLKHLRPKAASLACLGNHDYGLFHPKGGRGVPGLGDYLAGQLEQAGICVLMNQAKTFVRSGSAIQFVGLEDIWSQRYSPCQAFEQARPGLPTVGLCHNPDAAWHVAFWGADWVLSGHTHGSGTGSSKLHALMLPSQHRVFYAGQYSLGGGKFLYVNRGLGYARRWNINSRPEITLFTLRPSA